eukprot:gnl/MRDRNA2_/MRDRNA2_78983_c0_seq2.p1 gnl/MRDRNA2_/MRDRNA2_78983_c0~~gnl/MRDRNA2_/MRDRNA2_78983_c0_seq2.p1  ORF type:complete len:1191 (-),score=334.40 gnl/MRDRNA2_/MRDRNA2_78983_c0_seq2:162-3212(-)
MEPDRLETTITTLTEELGNSRNANEYTREFGEEKIWSMTEDLEVARKSALQMESWVGRLSQELSMDKELFQARVAELSMELSRERTMIQEEQRVSHLHTSRESQLQSQISELNTQLTQECVMMSQVRAREALVQDRMASLSVDLKKERTSREEQAEALYQKSMLETNLEARIADLKQALMGETFAEERQRMIGIQKAEDEETQCRSRMALLTNEMEHAHAAQEEQKELTRSLMHDNTLLEDKFESKVAKLTKALQQEGMEMEAQRMIPKRLKAEEALIESRCAELSEKAGRRREEEEILQNRLSDLAAELRRKQMREDMYQEELLEKVSSEARLQSKVVVLTNELIADRALANQQWEANMQRVAHETAMENRIAALTTEAFQNSKDASEKAKAASQKTETLQAAFRSEVQKAETLQAAFRSEIAELSMELTAEQGAYEDQKQIACQAKALESLLESRTSQTKAVASLLENRIADLTSEVANEREIMAEQREAAAQRTSGLEASLRSEIAQLTTQRSQERLQQEEQQKSLKRRASVQGDLEGTVAKLRSELVQERTSGEEQRQKANAQSAALDALREVQGSTSEGSMAQMDELMSQFDLERTRSHESIVSLENNCNDLRSRVESEHSRLLQVEDNQSALESNLQAQVEYVKLINDELHQKCMAEDTMKQSITGLSAKLAHKTGEREQGLRDELILREAQFQAELQSAMEDAVLKQSQSQLETAKLSNALEFAKRQEAAELSQARAELHQKDELLHQSNELLQAAQSQVAHSATHASRPADWDAFVSAEQEQHHMFMAKAAVPQQTAIFSASKEKQMKVRQQTIPEVIEDIEDELDEADLNGRPVNWDSFIEVEQNTFKHFLPSSGTDAPPSKRAAFESKEKQVRPNNSKDVEKKAGGRLPADLKESRRRSVDWEGFVEVEQTAVKALSPMSKLSPTPSAKTKSGKDMPKLKPLAPYKSPGKMSHALTRAMLEAAEDGNADAQYLMNTDLIDEETVLSESVSLKKGRNSLGKRMDQSK